MGIARVSQEHLACWASGLIQQDSLYAVPKDLPPYCIVGPLHIADSQITVLNQISATFDVAFPASSPKSVIQPHSVAMVSLLVLVLLSLGVDNIILKHCFEKYFIQHFENGL